MIPFGLAGAGELVPQGDGLAASVPEGWGQGRTAYGGWSAALALAAARWLAQEQGIAPLPRLASAMVNFIGPVTDTVEARPRLLRRGRNAVWIGVDLLAQGGADVVLAATFVFMSPRESAVTLSEHPAWPDVLPPDACQLRAARHDDPAFLARFETRLLGHRSEQGQSSHARWVRLADRTSSDPEAEILAITDYMLPGAVNWLGYRVPLSSMTWQLNLTGPLTVTPDGWWLAGARALHAAGGVSTEQIGVWDPSGQSVAIAQQAVAVFG